MPSVFARIFMRRVPRDRPLAWLPRPADSRRAPSGAEWELTVPRAAAHYVGALLGPSLLLLPGLAAQQAGAAAVLAWGALLVLSALLGFVFSRLGSAHGSRAGVSGYATAGLGAVVGRATGWAFFLGVVTGAPIVCLVGGEYMATVLGRPGDGAAFAGGLLLTVLFLRLRRAGDSGGLQLVLVTLLLLLLAVAVVAGLGAARAENWRPFLAHGWSGVALAAGHLMMAFVGWEAAAPLSARLRAPRRQLPRVIATAFVVTAVVHLSLAATLQAVLGAAAASTTPLAALLDVGVGPVGPWLAMLAALLLTLGVTHTYLAGAAATAQHLWRRGESERRAASSHPLLTVGVAVFGAVLLGLSVARLVDLSLLVALPTVFFLLVYLACGLAAVRLLGGAARGAAGVAASATTVLLVVDGAVSALACALVAAVTAGTGRAGAGRGRPRDRNSGRGAARVDEERAGLTERQR